MVVAAMTSLLVLAQLAMDVRKQEEAAGGAGREREERRLMLLLGVWLVAIYLAGFSIALPLCAGYYWRTRAGASWPATLAAAAAAVALLEGVLGKALGIGLYPGALSEWMLP